MKILFVLFFFILFNQNIFAQIDTTKSWIEDYSNHIVSFGLDTSSLYQNGTNKFQNGRVFKVLGTGVIFYIKHFNGKDTISVPTIVTAKHVLKDSTKNFFPRTLNIRFKWDERKPLEEYFGSPIDLYDENGNKNWYEHPDSLVDLACITVNHIKDFKKFQLPIFPYGLIQTLENAYESQEVFVFGFPEIGGIQYATKPIIRRGIVSWISPLNPNKVPFLIDCDIYPGNSGGPVFLNESGLGTNGKYNSGPSFTFLGIVSQMLNRYNPVFNQKSQLIFDTNKQIIYGSESFSLGIIEPAYRVVELLRETEKIFKLKSK